MADPVHFFKEDKNGGSGQRSGEIIHLQSKNQTASLVPQPKINKLPPNKDRAKGSAKDKKNRNTTAALSAPALSISNQTVSQFKKTTYFCLSCRSRIGSGMTDPASTNARL